MRQARLSIALNVIQGVCSIPIWNFTFYIRRNKETAHSLQGSNGKSVSGPRGQNAIILGIRKLDQAETHWRTLLLPRALAFLIKFEVDR